MGARPLIVALAWLGLVSPAVADEAPLFYARTQIVIIPSQSVMPAQAATPSLPWLAGRSAPADAPPRRIIFDTEQRDARTVHTAGWINLSEMTNAQALMLVLATPVTAAIRPVRDYSPYDVLTVSEQGRIMQILPRLVLADMREPYQTPQPVKAIIYLRGGTCEEMGIAPGDRVLNTKLFTLPTRVLEAAPGP